MSNSRLITYTRLSPNFSKRKKKISKITIHHMAGNLNVYRCGAIFANESRRASSNYGIDTDGRIALYVDEANRSWCSSNSANDDVAVTIEVANDGGAPDWHVSDKAMAALIDLCVDICQRNDIKRLNFTGNKKGNLTMHCYFAATECPGSYLKSKFSYIAKEVNKRLAAKDKFEIGNKVKLVSGAKYYDGKAISSWVFKKTLYVRSIDGERIVVSTLKSGAITGAVDRKYLKKV